MGFCEESRDVGWGEGFSGPWFNSFSHFLRSFPQEVLNINFLYDGKRARSLLKDLNHFSYGGAGNQRPDCAQKPRADGGLSSLQCP